MESKEMFAEGKDSWTAEELALISAWKEESYGRNDEQIGRCANCRFWHCNNMATPFCDVCLTRGLQEGRRLGRVAAEEEAGTRAAGGGVRQEATDIATKIATMKTQLPAFPQKKRGEVAHLEVERGKFLDSVFRFSLC